jgi:RNA polymerase sigma-70 factor (ECF subfamily)
VTTHAEALGWAQRCCSPDAAARAAAVEDLVRTYQPRLYRLALSLLDDPAEADEATQDTFVAALRALPAYRGQAALGTWLTAIGVNVCRSRRRRGAAWGRLRSALEAAARQRGPGETGPEAAAIRREGRERVWQAVMALGDKHRLPVILRYYHDLPTAEIAQVLGLSEGTVHSRLWVARDRLRVALRGLEGLEVE